MPLSYDPDLLAEIQKIKAIDHHAHALPARSLAPGEAERPDPLGRPPFPYPVRLRVTHAEYIDAWRALYGYRHEDMSGAHAREALQAKLELIYRMGEEYPAWVLDQAGIERMLVCMPSLGPGLRAPRFLWVVQADGLLLPFADDVQAMGANIGPGKTPATLDAYLDGVVHAQLEAWKDAGAVAIKFGIAYRRALDVADVPAEEASAIYERRVQGGTMSAADDKALQDHLFRDVSREAGRLGLAVHIHTGIGADPYFNVSGSNPMLLESVFNDRRLRQTRFCMLHGGWPFEREAGAMLIKPNVYADFSAQVFLRSTRALAGVLEEWLSWYPEKVFFGTDAYPDDTPLANWEEKCWLATRTAREALALALTRMVVADQVTFARAVELARRVLRENAIQLYGLETVV
jgi:predicted TIM-barrel fold metal-dependent hydrolase